MIDSLSGQDVSPVVSVITPSCNQAQFLEHTIRSVIEQEYPSLEYLIIDGASTDGSVDVIRKYESYLAYWVSEPDSGQTEAINKGLARASGEYVAWLNSDDVYLPGAVSQAVAALEENPEAAMVYANAIRIEAEGEPIGWPTYRQFSLEELLSMRIICQPTVFMRRRILGSVHGLDPTYHLLMDHHLWIRIARVASILYVDEYWAAARQHGLAKNTVQRLEFVDEARRIIDELSQFCDIAEIVGQHYRQIKAGLKVFGASYLLDDNQSGRALQDYSFALLQYPASIRWMWHLMILSCLRTLGLHWCESFLRALKGHLHKKPSIQISSIGSRSQDCPS